MVQLGYSAGARSKPAFHWVRNVQKPRSHAPGTEEKRDRDASCAFAYFWNLAKNRVPEEVIADFESFMASLEIGRMDGRSTMAGDGAGAKAGTLAGESISTGEYSISPSNQVYAFHNAQLAPPTGVMAANYSR